MGFFSNLGTEAYDRKYNDRDLLLRIGRYFRPQVGRLIVIGICLILVSLAGAAAPIVVALSVDLIGDDLSLLNISLIAAAVLLTGLVTWIANWVRRRLTGRAVGDVVKMIRVDAFSASAHHDLSFYDTFSSGRIVSRITSDTQEFANVVILVTDLASQLAQTIILAIYLFRTEWRLSLMLVAFLPVVFMTALAFRRMARYVTSRGMRAMGNVNQAIKETISGISVAKNFRQEMSIYQDFDESNQQSYTVNVKRGFVLALVFPVLNAVNSLGTAVLVYFGGLSAAQGIVTAGAWYLFILSLDRFWFPVLNLSSFWTQIQAGLSSAERVFALIDAESGVKQVENKKVGSLAGRIRFDNLSFRYNEQEQILKNFNLDIQAGENIALVGHTGSGKTSIARLIARFYEFQEGRLLIDEQDIRSFGLQDYRKRLGIVSQVPFLFSGTVAENIRYAVPDAAEEQILELANKIGDGEWLETLPEGLDTQVGERGSRLSMGQRQLIALLRVLVQKPSIFILDEATASIDPFTEWQIQQALKMVLANTTSILIAHRLSTIKSADRILVVQKGKVIEEGNHSSLMSQGGHYATLYDTYFRHQSLAYVEAAHQFDQ